MRSFDQRMLLFVYRLPVVVLPSIFLLLSDHLDNMRELIDEQPPLSRVLLYALLPLLAIIVEAVAGASLAAQSAAFTASSAQLLRLVVSCVLCVYVGVSAVIVHKSVSSFIEHLVGLHSMLTAPSSLKIFVVRLQLAQTYPVPIQCDLPPAHPCQGLRVPVYRCHYQVSLMELSLSCRTPFPCASVSLNVGHGLSTSAVRSVLSTFANKSQGL